ncbi:hypothetical protein GJ496_011016 [Pomphorhynchus laevis]|nr:hypothetical protein GJ496_011016 [Pomphorhynchus laevis]
MRRWNNTKNRQLVELIRNYGDKSWFIISLLMRKYFKRKSLTPELCERQYWILLEEYKSQFSSNEKPLVTLYRTFTCSYLSELTLKMIKTRRQFYSLQKLAEDIDPKMSKDINATIEELWSESNLNSSSLDCESDELYEILNITAECMDDLLEEVDPSSLSDPFLHLIKSYKDPSFFENEFGPVEDNDHEAVPLDPLN